jgi:hypothetical protein
MLCHITTYEISDLSICLKWCLFSYDFKCLILAAPPVALYSTSHWSTTASERCTAQWLVWWHNIQLLCWHIRALPPRHFAEWFGPGPVGLCRTRFYTEEGLYNRRKDELHNLGPTAAVAMLPASHCRNHSEQYHWKGELQAVMAKRFAEIHQTSLTGINLY